MTPTTKTYRSNSKEVRIACAFHVCDYYDNSQDLIADYNAVDRDARKLVEGGNFLISYYDQREWLESLHLNNNSGREFTDDEVFKMYVLLVSRAIESIVNNGVRGALAG
jgi:hypothetical protein